MAVNKVVYGGNTLIDLSGDTLVSPDQLLKDIVAHCKDGSTITGTLEAGGGSGIVKGTFTLAATQKNYAFAEIEYPLNLPDVIFVYKTDYTEDDKSWLIAVSVKIADKFYQVALRNNSTLSVIKSSTSDLFSSSCIRVQELTTQANLIFYMTAYYMQPGTYEYMYYWF